MTAIRNQVQLIGHLGKKPETKTLTDGKMVTKFSLATSEFYTNNKGEKIQDTQWHNIVAWGKTAEIIDKLLDKGDEVLVNGKITYRQYDDKDGIKRNISEIIANEILSFAQKKN